VLQCPNFSQFDYNIGTGTNYGDRSCLRYTGSQQAGIYARPSAVRIVEFDKISVPEQLTTLNGKKAVDAGLVHKGQVQVICLEQAALARAFTGHASLLIWAFEQGSTKPRKT